MFGQNVSLAHWLRIAAAVLVTFVETTGQAEHTIVLGGRTRWFVEHNTAFQKGNPVIISLHAGGANMRRCTVQDFKEGNLVLCPNGADYVSLRTDPGPQKKYWNIYQDYSTTSNPKVRDDFATIDDVGSIAALAKWAFYTSSNGEQIPIESTCLGCRLVESWRIEPLLKRILPFMPLSPRLYPPYPSGAKDCPSPIAPPHPCS
jgi:hypothetical protein